MAVPESAIKDATRVEHFMIADDQLTVKIVLVDEQTGAIFVEELARGKQSCRYRKRVIRLALMRRK